MKYLIVIILLILGSNVLLSQSGMRFPELEKKLEPYFDKDLITDIKTQLPHGSDFTIWGWDVGDFSGDGFNDVAFSIKLSAEKRKIVQVYLFVEIDGFLTKVAQYNYDYFEIPLEIGVAIKENICYVTKKRKQFDWMIKGYHYENGIIMLFDEFTTKRIEDKTQESYRNYQTLKNTEKFLVTTSNETKFVADYLTIPSYTRGRLIYKGFSSEAISKNIDYVQSGAYYWKGEYDASFSTKSSFDDEYLYMTVSVKDDKVVTLSCDTCQADYIEVWFDIIPPERKPKSDIKPLPIIDSSYSNQHRFTPSGIYNIKFYPGDFLEKKAFIKNYYSSDNMEYTQIEAVKNINAVSSLRPDGYDIKFRIPFTFFGIEASQMDLNLVEFGCTLILHDIDNEYRPEEETQIATSKFDSNDPSSYGSLMFIPQGKWYGESSNIYRDDFIKFLLEYGF